MRFRTALLILALTLPAMAQRNYIQQPQQVVASSGTSSGPFSDNLGTATHTFALYFSVSPTGASVVIQGWMLDTSGGMSSPTATTLSPSTTTCTSTTQACASTVTGGYDYYTVTPTWTGGGTVTIRDRDMVSRIGGSTGGGASFSATPGIVYNTSTTASTNATSSNLATLLQTASGCSTAGQSYNPATNTCTAAGGGATLPYPGIVYATSASAGTVATATQVQAAYNPNPNTTGILGEYQFTAGSGTTVPDVSSANNTLNFASGANAPTGWVGTLGLQLLPQGGTSQYLTPTTAVLTVGTAYTAYCNVPGTLNTGTGGTTPPSVATLWGTVPGTNGIVFGAINQGFGFRFYSQINGTGGYQTTTSDLGGCYLATWVGGNGAATHIYITPLNGSLGGTYESTYTATFAYSTAQTTASTTYILGANYPTNPNNQFNGNLLYHIWYSGQHTLAQVQNEAIYIQRQIYARPGFLPVPTRTQALLPSGLCYGDSLTAPAYGTDWCMATVTNNTYAKTTIGYFGMPLTDMDAMAPLRLVPNLPLNCGAGYVNVFGGTNDIQQGIATAAQLVQSATDIANQVHAACPSMRMTLMTPISRTGQDTNLLPVAAAFRANYKSMGYQQLIDLAENPLLSLNGTNNTNATYYYSDDIHLRTAGDLLIQQADQNAINFMDGGTPQQPLTLTATGAIGFNGYVVANCGSACTLTLPDCTALTGSQITVTNPLSAGAVVIAPASGQLINTSSVSVPLQNRQQMIFTDTLTSPTAGGCSWTAAPPGGLGFNFTLNASATTATYTFPTPYASRPSSCTFSPETTPTIFNALNGLGWTVSTTAVTITVGTGPISNLTIDGTCTP